MGETLDVLDPQRWGLPPVAPGRLTGKFRRTCRHFRSCFDTRTGHPSRYAEIYLKGLLLMETERNYANMARRVIGPEDDGQNLQQFMSDSPWKEQRVFDQIQRDVARWPELHGGSLIVDESAFERDGDKSAGAGRQHLGRFGKVDMGQVGVGLGYYKDGTWALVDAELFMPEHWFDDAHADLRRRSHVPEDLAFRSKPEMGLAMVRRAKGNGLPFKEVLADSLYGRKHGFRADLDQDGILYIADIPVGMKVYLERPTVGIPDGPAKARGRRPSQPRVLSEATPVEVSALAKTLEPTFQTVEIRETERGMLKTKAVARRVWTLTEAMEVREEWLLIWKKPNGKLGFSLSNYPPETSLETLVGRRANRYFIERIFEDGKSENGWDEFQARKYRAWHHDAALQALALWFIAEVKLEYKRDYPRDPRLKEEFELEVLPALSTANVREMFRAALPLPRLSMKEANQIVTRNWVNRSRSTCSRRKKQARLRGP